MVNLLELKEFIVAFLDPPTLEVKTNFDVPKTLPQDS